MGRHGLTSTSEQVHLGNSDYYNRPQKVRFCTSSFQAGRPDKEHHGIYVLAVMVPPGQLPVSITSTIK